MHEEQITMKDMVLQIRDDIFDRIDRLDRVNSERFDKVDAAQAHTNGDVSDLKVWRGYLTGGLAVIIMLVIPLIIYVWNQSQDQRVTIDTLLNSKPTAYENSQNH